MSDWQPKPCRHGVRPIITQQQIAIGTAPLETYLLGRKEFRYDCPTPIDCWSEAIGRKAS